MSSSRAFYLELAALGVDFSKGTTPPLDLSCGEVGRLIDRLDEHREGLKEVLVWSGVPDLEAVFQEGRRGSPHFVRGFSKNNLNDESGGAA